MAVGCGVRTSDWAFRGRCLRLAREREAALPGRSKPVVERSASRECVYPTGCLPGLPNRLSAMFSPRAMFSSWSQRQSCSQSQRCPSSLAPTCLCGAQACYARTDPVARCGWASTSPYLDRPLAPAICGGASLGSSPAGGQASSSSTACGAFASSLELAGSARTQRLVGTTAVPCHCRWRSRFSSYELTKEELATKEAFSMPCPSPSE